MSALTPEQRARHRQLGESLRSAILKTRELNDGYEYEFAMNPATYHALAEITPLEHACCPFFTIALRLEHSKLVWQLTGDEGITQFIRMEFAEWFR